MKRGGHDGPQEGGGAEAPRMKRRANFNERQKAKHRKQARNMRQEKETGSIRTRTKGSKRQAKGKGSIQIRKGRANAEEATKGHREGMEQEHSLRRRRAMKPRRTAGTRRSNR